jgi:hypothetical protein
MNLLWKKETKRRKTGFATQAFSFLNSKCA